MPLRTYSASQILELESVHSLAAPRAAPGMFTLPSCPALDNSNPTKSQTKLPVESSLPSSDTSWAEPLVPGLLLECMWCRGPPATTWTWWVLHKAYGHHQSIRHTVVCSPQSRPDGASEPGPIHSRTYAPGRDVQCCGSASARCCILAIVMWSQMSSLLAGLGNGGMHDIERGVCAMLSLA